MDLGTFVLLKDSTDKRGRVNEDKVVSDLEIFTFDFLMEKV